MSAQAQLSERSDATLGSFLEQLCTYYSELVAIRSLRDGRRIQITYGKLSLLAREIAGGLLKQGLRPGDTICIFGGSSIEWVLAWLAIQYIGAVDVAFENNRDPKQMQRLAESVGARMVFCDHEQMLEELEKTAKLRLFHLSWTLPGNFQSPRIQSLHDLRNAGLRSFGLKLRLQQLRARRSHEDIASVFFKRPRYKEDPLGVVHSYRGLIRNIQDYALTVMADENDLILSTQPFWHSSGRLALLFSFYKACTIFPSTDASFLTDMQEQNPSLVFTNPGCLEHFYKRISSGSLEESLGRILARRFYLKICQTWNTIHHFIFEGQKEETQNRFLFFASTLALLLPLWFFLGPLRTLGHRLFYREIRDRLGSRLRHILCGGQKLHPRVDDFFHTLNIPIFESYWLTEAGFVVASRIVDVETIGQGDRLARGSVGMLLPSMALKLVDHKGDDVSTMVRTTGLIYIKGDNLMLGYLHEPGLTKELLDENGWLKTGDRGYLLPTGDLRLLPRQSNFLAALD